MVRVVRAAVVAAARRCARLSAGRGDRARRVGEDGAAGGVGALRPADADGLGEPRPGRRRPAATAGGDPRGRRRCPRRLRRDRGGRPGRPLGGGTRGPRRGPHRRVPRRARRPAPARPAGPRRRARRDRAAGRPPTCSPGCCGGTRPGCELVLAARSDPPLALPRLRVEGLLTELRAEGLRFAPDEAAALLEASGAALDARDVAVLHHRTEGWAGGLRLAAIALRRSDDPSGGPRRLQRGRALGRRLPDRGGARRAAGGEPRRPAGPQRVRAPADRARRGAHRATRRGAHVLDELVVYVTAMVERNAPAEYRLHGLLRSHLVADLARHRPGRHRHLQAAGDPVVGRSPGDRPRPAPRGARGRPGAPVADLVRRDGVRLLLARRPRPAAGGAGFLVGPRGSAGGCAPGVDRGARPPRGSGPGRRGGGTGAGAPCTAR